MKCWNSTFNTQGLRGIIVVIQGVMKLLYVIVVEAFRRKEKYLEI
jgi:hypothetical protein